MKKSKSINFSFLVLVLLFVLTQTTFAITAGISSEGSGTEAQQAQILQEPAKTLTYDIDTDGDKVFMTGNSAISTLAVAETPATKKVETTAPAQSAPTVAVASATPAPQIKSVVRYVNADSLNVRAEANSTSKLVATVKRGDKVTYYETTGEWARIITWSDQKGYVLAKYLANSAPAVAKTTVAAKASTTVSRGTSDSTESSKPASSEALSLTEKIISYAKSLQGIKYVYGGYSKSGFDCSGFTKYVFAHYDISVPRSASEYYSFGTKVSRSDIRAGDILLFDTDGGSADVSHVGLYIGGGNFIHASTTKGRVIIMNFNSYPAKYMGARRVID